MVPDDNYSYHGDHCVICYANANPKVNLKCIADLNERPEPIKLPEENVGIIKLLQENLGSMLFGNSLSNAFLNMSPPGLP